VTFNVPADAYTRFMGRYSQPLAEKFVATLAPRGGDQVVDVGCGPGAVTALLVERLGPGAVCAVDPSAPFVAATRARFPDVDVRQAAAEELPWPSDTFDLALAQLVVHFMADPVAGLQEMGRVTRRGGRVAASVWDYGGDRSPLSVFWQAVHDVDPSNVGESQLAGARDGHLVELMTAAGLGDVQQGVLSIRVPLTGFDDWWEPFTFGVGPAGQYVAGLDGDARGELRSLCATRLPEGPFELEAAAWLATGRA
jgi:SAM-dependent methyltransferase